jgi:hypothetical protein
MTANQTIAVSEPATLGRSETELIRLYKLLSPLDKVRFICYLEEVTDDGSISAEKTKSLKAQFCAEILEAEDEVLSIQDRMFKLTLRIYMILKSRSNDDFWAALYDKVDQHLSEITCDYEPIKGL